MKKLYTVLGKNWFWVCLFILVLIQIPNLYQQLWYGDEGIYAAVGSQIFDGKIMYLETWDHKPPFILVLFGLIGEFVGWEKGIVLLRFLGLATILATFILISKVLSSFNFSKKLNRVGQAIAVFLIGSTFLESNIVNAEVLFVPFSLITILILNSTYKYKYWIAGAILFVGYTIKIHSFLEIGYIILLFSILLFVESRFSTKSLRTIFANFLKVGIGFAIPFSIVLIYFASNGALYSFIDATLLHNFLYSSSVEESGRTFLQQNHNILLILTLLSILFYSTFLFTKKLIGQRSFLIVNIVAVEFVAAQIGGRNYLHYFYQMAPGIVFLCVLLVSKISKQNLKYTAKNAFILLLVIPFALLYFMYFSNGIPENYTPLRSYYKGFISKHVLQNTKEDAFWWSNTQNFEPVAEFVNTNYTKEDVFYVYSNSPWLIAILQNVSVSNKYTVSFHLGFGEKFLQEDLQNMINSDYVLEDSRVGMSDIVKNTLVENFVEKEKIDTYTIWEKL